MTTATATPSPLQALRILATDIKIGHSIFALPFALLGGFMAAAPLGTRVDWPTLAGQLALIVGCMVCARTVAMLANRLLDRRIDADNPRTSARAIPSGRVSAGRATGVLFGSAALFMAGCGGFGLFYSNWWPLVLGIPVLLWISAYGVFKRFTSACHVYLGSSLAISPVAAAVAIDPTALNQPAIWFLAGMVLVWVAGFDIIYALQDVEVDRKQALHSLPSRLGEGRALWISRAAHLIAIGLLAGAVLVDDRLGILFAIGAGVVTFLLIYEHATVHRWGTTKIALAFFTLNGIISCLLGGLGVADILW